MSRISYLLLPVFVLGLLVPVSPVLSAAAAAQGAAFTTVDPAVDGVAHCANGNPSVNCNLYDGKQFVWLNGGPQANHLGPDGKPFFFAVLEPGGQSSPNDGGAKNLSSSIDAYTNRTFTVQNGEVSAYSGTHWFDSGSHALGPADRKPPFIRLFPFADTSDPGGVYILAICSLANGYPVRASDCKFDQFKVRAGAPVSTPSATPTVTVTSTATSTETATSTSTSTATSTETATSTATGTATSTETATSTATGTATSTETATSTATGTATSTETATSTATATATSTATSTPTPTPISCAPGTGSTNSGFTFPVPTSAFFDEVPAFPASQLSTDYWFPWYDFTLMSSWVVVTNTSKTQSADVEIFIAGALKDSHTIPANSQWMPSYPSVFTGPLEVKSTNGVNILASQRILYHGGLTETLGLPANQLSTDYWYPWYDFTLMSSWVVVGNTSSTQSADVQIFIGGALVDSHTIPANGVWTPFYLGTFTGPLEVRSTNGVNIDSSQRILYNGGFEETLGLPANQLTADYSFASYDFTTMETWIAIGNASSTQPADVQIFMGGQLVDSHTIPAMGTWTPAYPGTSKGPVEVKSTNAVNITTSERILDHGVFRETMGLGASQLGTDNWIPWYDNIAMSGQLIIANPSTTSTAHVCVYIAGILVDSLTVAPGTQVTRQYNLQNGPVEIISDIPVSVIEESVNLPIP